MALFEIILSCILASVTVVYLCMNYKVDLQMMQQNSYRNNRYFKWWKTNNDYCSVSRIVDLIVLLLMLSQFNKIYVVIPLSTGILAAKAAILTKKRYKKPLVFTKRVWRLFITMCVFSAIVTAIVAFSFVSDAKQAIYAGTSTLVALNVASWLVLVISNRIMKPVESAINKMYIDDARQLLRQMPDLKIVGITGSYGKTSTKHYLHRILSEQFDVLMTPGSFNTPMGVVRTVRELMKPYNNVFIVEMGAKQKGDIREICDIVHPEIGIVTAVGEQHLESFKSIENVQRTKFELIDALPQNGFAVVNDDFPFIANREIENVKTCRYAVKNTTNANYRATDIQYGEFGTRFTIIGENRHISLETRLVGECNISNLMAAVIVALHLGVDEDKIRFAVSKIEQVEHRLNMKRTPAGVTIIDDAFNSNPDGSRMALDVLVRMTSGRRIIVTPGMIELGAKQAELNRTFGTHIANSCDFAIIVGQYNREAIVEGIRQAGKLNENAVILAESFADAQNKLSGLLKTGDTVLYENDLPDTFK